MKRIKMNMQDRPAVMFLLLRIALLLVVLSGASARRKSRIIRGSEARPHEFPSIVNIRINIRGEYKHNCGGTLLNKRTVLTAAHCYKPDKQYKIIAGAHRISEVERTSGAQSALVTGAVIHPKLNRTYYNFDFVLLKLDRDIQTGPTVKFVRLPTERYEFRDAEKSCVVAGWGMWQDLSMDPSDVLRKGPMKVNYFQNEILNAAPDGPNLSSTCIGDSGGPLYCPAKDGGDPYEVGLLTGGAGICGHKRGYKTFARIAYVIDWIKQNA